MACLACLVCLVSTVCGCHKNLLGRGSASCGHITKLEPSTFLRYLWFSLKSYGYIGTADLENFSKKT
jgi:hypothetical protein